MDRVEDPAAHAFAMKILREHPHIAYEHAVSAAEYAGVKALSPRTFFAAVDQLEIRRPADENRLQVEAERVAPPSVQAAAPAPRSTAESSPLLEQLDALRRDVGETAQIREALLQMQKVVRAALAEED